MKEGHSPLKFRAIDYRNRISSVWDSGLPVYLLFARFVQIPVFIVIPHRILQSITNSPLPNLKSPDGVRLGEKSPFKIKNYQWIVCT